jgi:hypothetical protein
MQTICTDVEMITTKPTQEKSGRKKQQAMSAPPSCVCHCHNDDIDIRDRGTKGQKEHEHPPLIHVILESFIHDGEEEYHLPQGSQLLHLGTRVSERHGIPPYKQVFYGEHGLMRCTRELEDGCRLHMMVEDPGYFWCRERV